MSSDSEKDCQVIETKILSDAKWFKSLDDSERQLLEKNKIPFEELEDKKVVCTACFKQGNHKQTGFFVRHPNLGVPICKACKTFYFRGEWRQDDEGKFEHCGWCAQGGELLCCDKCPNAFCTKCIKRNLGRQAVSKIEDQDNWRCFECEPKQLLTLRALFYSIYLFWKSVDEKIEKKEKAKATKNKVKARSDCITRSLSDASACANLEKVQLTKENNTWSKVSDSDYSDQEVKFKAAKDFAKFLAVRQKNLNQLKARFFDHVDKDSIFDEDQRQTIANIVEDLESIANGDLNEIALKKEKVKFQVLKDSDDEESDQVQLTNGKNNDDDDENHDLDSSSNDSNEDIDSEVDSLPQKKKTSAKKRESKTKTKRESVKIKLFGKKRSKVETSESENESSEEDLPKKNKKSSNSKKVESEEESSEEDSKKKKTSNSKKAVQEDTDSDIEISEIKKSSNKSNKEIKDSKKAGSDIENSENKKSSKKSSEVEEVLKKAGLEDSDTEVSKSKKSPKKLDEVKKESNAKANEKSNLDSIKKEVLQTTSEEESDDDFVGKKAGPKSKTKSPAKKNKKSKSDIEDSPKKAGPKSKTRTPVKSESEDSDDIDEKESLNECKLKQKFESLIKEIDVKNDSKLNNKCEVVVERLTNEQESKLKETNNSIVLDKKERKPRIKSEGAKFDAEINRLCNLGALKKLTKRYNSQNKSSKTNKMKNGKAKKEVKLEDLSSDNSEGEISFRKKSMKNSLPNKNDLAKEAVLASSDESDVEMEEENVKKGKKSKKSNENEESSKKSSNSKSTKRRQQDPDFMRVKLDETDSEEEERKAKKRKEKAKKAVLDDSGSDFESPKKNAKSPRKSRKKKESESDDEDEEEENTENSDEEEKNDSDSEIETSKKKVAKKRKKKSDTSSGEASDEEPRPKKKRGRKKKKSDSSSPEDSDEEPRPKKKRRRIKKNSDDSDENNEGEDESPTKKGGRKDIRRIIKDKKLSKETKTAAEDERERRKRVAERQELYNEMVTIKDNEIVKEVPLDIDPETKEILVEVNKDLCKQLKPHQARGIKFMFEAVFETKKDVEEGKCPGGAILAHCMGLGKTLQTIGMIHTVMTAFPEKIKCVLVVAPVNTLKNWEDEFYKWLKGDMEDDIEVYEVSGAKDNIDRADRLRYWKRKGGALIMGYDMYRNLTNDTTKKFKKHQKAIFQECLVDPGPDMVVCDEGHILKNTKSALNIAMNKIKTRRRIVLTGTPIQNNLSEYFSMVDFIKPKLLGTYIEFKNRFVNPISNGQSSDSTARDVRIMKKRSFILNDLLKGCMQRLDYNVLVPFLQAKHEYVLCICLTEFQKKLYTYYLENYARAGQIGSDGKLEGGKKGGLFYDVQNLARVWNHPYILLKAKEKADIAKMMQDDADEDTHFINDDGSDESEAKSTSSEESGSENSEVEEIQKRKVTTRKTKDDDEKLIGGLDEAKADELKAHRGWWGQFMKDSEDEDELLNVELGSKMIILMDILRECYLIGDKVLVFSQSLLSLDLIETFLHYSQGEDSADNWSWTHGRDYYRMDGSTAPDVRKKWCSYFNNKKHTDMRLFLISTKAGGLGINLVAANRVIIFDASWNPAHDVQSIFRVYRFGQEKPVYIYRFLAKGTMEEKIYDRQVTKQSLSARVVDEQQIERHFTMNELVELYTYQDEAQETRPEPLVPKDKLLAEIILKHKNLIWKIHDHDSLLENQVDEHLTEEQRKEAWEEFENEKKGIVNMASSATLNTNLLMQMQNVQPEMIKAQYRMQYPHLTEDQLNQATRAYMMQIQSGFTGRTNAYDKSFYQQEMARAKMMNQAQYPGMYGAARGARPTDHVSNQDLTTAAQQLLNYQRQLQIQRARQLAAVAGTQAKVQYNASKQQQPSILRKNFQPKPKSPKRAPETVTLDDDDDDDEEEVEDDDSDEVEEVIGEEGDDDDGEIVLDGAPEVAEYERPSTSRTRRGRPRLDPETDPVD